MRLKRLEIYGFKSFADRTIIEFDKGITGIVGPNGSGKSNLSDAVRWVLGEQSAKSLRGGKMEDIIFNGTEKRKRLGYCEVSLVFDNEDRKLPVDYSEVMVTRRAYRAGEGEYFLNKTTCRLKDILDLFQDTGIGRDGYSIIGQGRIDEILSQKSDDRRDVFDEAAGIVKYRARKEESEKRLSNMRDNVVRIEDILHELESQLEPLEKASRTARRYLTLHDELRILECTQFVLHTDRDSVRIETLKQQIQAMADQNAKQEKEAASLSEKREELNSELSDLERSARDAHARLLELTREAEAREGGLKVTKTQLEHTQKEQSEAELQLENRKIALHETQQFLDTNSEDLQKSQELAAELQEASSNAEIALEKAQQAVDEAEKNLECQQSAYISSLNKLSDVKSSAARLETMKSQLLAKQAETEEEEKKLNEDAEGLIEQIEDAEKDADKISAQTDEKQNELAAAEIRLQNCTEEINRSFQNLDALNEERAQKESRLHVLEDMVRDYSGYQFSVKNVLQRASGDKRVRGIIAGLIHVPKELEKAIESVLGAALQNIVTDDEYTARDMISYLRKNNMGRATFLPLTTIHGKTLNSVERQCLSMSGCIGVASELIQYDPEYREIIENLLGRTVIASNLDSGIAIMRRAHQAFRLVTLDGDVMHSGGSMTGGSASSRMTSLLSRDREIEEHKKTIIDLHDKIESIKCSIDQARSRKTEENTRTAVIREEIQHFHIDASVVSERLRSLQHHGLEQEEKKKKLNELKQQIITNLYEIDKQLNQIQDTQLDENESHVEMQRITQNLSDQIVMLRTDLDQKRGKAHQYALAFADKQKDLQEYKHTAERLTQEKAKLQHDISSDTERLDELKQSILSLEKEIEKQTAEIADCKEQLAAADANVREKDRQRAAETEQIRFLTESIDHIHGAVEDAAERIHRSEAALSKMQSELTQLEQRVWDEYELSYAGAKNYYKEDYLPSRDDPRINEIRHEIRGIGPVNLSATEEYHACKERFDDLTAQRNDLLKAQEDLQRIIRELQNQMETQFMTNFRLLQIYLQDAFSKLFGGGKAEIRLSDENDILGSGIEIAAQPPGKKLQLLTLLSGGERALTAIAILFAMLKLKPTPFCFLDEIEAALDDGNISTFAGYLKDFSRDTQFVIVTHRKGTMEHCDELYGVSMEEKGVSKLLSVELKDIHEDRLSN